MDEFNTLSHETQEAVLKAITLVQEAGGRQSLILPDQSEAYAYKGARGVHWGWNSPEGENKARGVWTEDAS